MDDKIFGLIEKMYSEMQKGFEEVRGEVKEVTGGLAEVRGEVKEVTGGLAEVRSEVKEVKLGLVRFESKVDNHLKALYDGYKQNTEKLYEVETKIDDLNNKVEGQEVEIRVIKGGK